MKKSINIFIAALFILSAALFSSPVLAVDSAGFIIKDVTGEKKIVMIGSDFVRYSPIDPERIETIGSKRVEYNLLGHITKIGDEEVTCYITSGKLIKVGNKNVVYSGNKISNIGGIQVFYE